jgi:hypothetical protein
MESVIIQAEFWCIGAGGLGSPSKRSGNVNIVGGAELGAVATASGERKPEQEQNGAAAVISCGPQ